MNFANLINRWHKIPTISKLLYISIILSVLLSGYILLMILLFKDKTHVGVFSTWQFCMLLALMIDMIYDKNLL